MTDTAAEAAYNQVVADLKKALLTVGSKDVEFSSFSAVAPTIDCKTGTFRLGVSNVTNAPVSLPMSGIGYTIVGSVNGWTTGATSRILMDANSSYVSAPSRNSAVLVISYGWTLRLWLASWITYLVRAVLRTIAWCVLLVLLALVCYGLWLAPWARIIGFVLGISKAAVELAANGAPDREGPVAADGGTIGRAPTVGNGP
jgi:hypothetical protein